MSNNYSPMSVVIEAAKKKGVRLQESDFRNEDVESLNQHVMVFRGAAADLVNSIFERDERGVSAHQVVHGSAGLLPGNNGRIADNRDAEVGEISEVVHRETGDVRATANDPKLSEPRGWRDRCVVGARRRPEAAGVTAARVRCSAWLGVICWRWELLVPDW